jgi:hypothetical protein
MDRLGFPFYESCSTKFVMEFPAIRKLRAQIGENCTYGKYDFGSKLRIAHSRVKDVVAFHMHRIPMELWHDQIVESENASIVWKAGPRFCTPLR